jgi:predicted RNase H-like HicB family nuclease
MEKIMDGIIDIWQNFYYGTLHRAPKVDLSVIPQSFQFHIHYDDNNKVFWIDSPDLPDFEASGKTLEELAKNIQDTLYVYFDIPRYFAIRSNMTSITNLRSMNYDNKIRQTQVKGIQPHFNRA